MARWTLITVALLLALRVFYAFVYVEQNSASGHREIGGDAADFLQLAWTLKETGRYGTPSLNDQPIDVLTPLLTGQPISIPSDATVIPKGWRPPAWPAVLAVFLGLSGGSLAGAMLWRFALDAASLILFAQLLRSTGWPLSAKAAALVIAALHPVWLIYSYSFLSEPLSLFLLLALANITITANRRFNSPTAAALGLTAGLVVLCHPLFLFASAGSLVWVAFGRYPERRPQVDGAANSRGRIAVAFGCFAVLVGLWIARNALVFDQWTVTLSSEHVLAMGWSEDFLELYNNATAEVVLPAGPGPLAFFTKHWTQVPLIAFNKAVGALGPIVQTHRPGILELGRYLWWILTFAPVWWCLVCSGALPPALQAVLRAQITGYLLMTVLTYPTIRFRAPLLALEVIAVVAFGLWLSRLINKRRVAQQSLRAN